MTNQNLTAAIVADRYAGTLGPLWKHFYDQNFYKHFAGHPHSRGYFGRECFEAGFQAAQSTIAAQAARIAELEARSLLDGIAMTRTAMERDRAMTNLEHWRQEVGKLNSQIAALKGNGP